MIERNIDINKIKPARGKLLGEIIEGNYLSTGGIYVVTTMKKKKPRKVKIISIGDYFENQKGKPQVYRAQPGQVAYFKMAEGKKLTVNRKEYLVLENEDIVAVEV